MPRTPPDILITHARVALPAAHLAARARCSRRSRRSSSTRSTRWSPTKRGAHLMLSLERLEALRARGAALQRIGLSATQRPLEEVARLPRRRRGRRATGWAAAGRDRRRGQPQGVRAARSRCRSRTWRASASRSTRCPSGPAPAARPRRAVDLAGDPPAAARADPRSTARRSCSSTAGASPSGWPRR